MWTEEKWVAIDLCIDGRVRPTEFYQEDLVSLKELHNITPLCDLGKSGMLHEVG